MKILHYSLGFPPFRTGGMTKYCMDLIFEQLNLGHDVTLLWPGRIIKYDNSVMIKEKRKYKISDKLYCNSYEIINPLPVSLLNGIQDVYTYTLCKDINVFKDLLQKEKFEVIHLHTLMGLPKEFLIAAKLLKIKIIFTSHDYFGLCPKCSLMQGNKVCKDDNNCYSCSICNKTALSLNKIKILQSPIYHLIKNTNLVKKIRKNKVKKLNTYYEDEKYMNSEIELKEGSNRNYILLRKYYIDCYKLIDLILFNSTNTKKIYSKYFNVENNSKIVSISNSMINNNKKIKNIHDKIHFGYFGPISSRKGFYFLISVLDEIYNSGITNFELHIHHNIQSDKEYIVCHEPYNDKNIAEAMNNIDMLIIPSLWYETFGFIALEALSFGVPVMVSENVGAKDLINEYNGIVFKLNKEDFKQKIIYCLNNKEILKKINENIYKNQEIKNMKAHAEEICEIYLDRKLKGNEE